MTRFSVVIPVKNGERYLDEILAALARERPDEVLVIDSGSTDRSVAIARAGGADVLQIDPRDFGHGRTRNLGAARTSGELICFLTQDATPCAGWRAAYEEAFSLDERVGAAYGPHQPRADTSPMIARELREFFASFAPDGRPHVQRLGDPSFLSNVNACYARACWEEVHFRDVAYAEDQAFGVDLLAAGWTKVYHPGAAVLHAHDYPWSEFMRRYFDEYRGLRETIGHVEPFGVGTTVRHVRASVAADHKFMRESGVSAVSRAKWLPRAAAHHGGRRVFSALGSRSERLRPAMRRTLSLEGRDGSPVQPDVEPAAVGAPASLPEFERIAPVRDHEFYDLVGRVWRDGPTPLLPPVPGMAERERLRIAMIIPSFSRGSGGHGLLFQLLSRLEARGHVCSVWMHDFAGNFDNVGAAVLRHDIREFFTPIQGAVFKGFEEWHGADVVIATGWQTVHAALQLPRCYARVYVVNDHEPEFYARSAEAVIAEDTYRQGLHCIAGSRWLRDLLVERYGATADEFEYGVDHDVYRPRPVTRRRDTVVYYARHETPRRAVPIGMMALAELHRRRPDVRIVLCGTDDVIWASFPYERAGVLSGDELSWLFSEATVGLSLSLTNFSLMPKEMLACGLPCVELAGIAAESIFGADGPIELAPLRPASLADALERLLDDQPLWERRSHAGIEFVASKTWDRAADQLEAGLRHALALRERAAAPKR